MTRRGQWQQHKPDQHITKTRRQDTSVRKSSWATHEKKKKKGEKGDFFLLLCTFRRKLKSKFPLWSIKLGAECNWQLHRSVNGKSRFLNVFKFSHFNFYHNISTLFSKCIMKKKRFLLSLFSMTGPNTLPYFWLFIQIVWEKEEMHINTDNSWCDASLVWAML